MDCEQDSGRDYRINLQCVNQTLGLCRKRQYQIEHKTKILVIAISCLQYLIPDDRKCS